MATKSVSKEAILPGPGATYLIPLTDGRFGLCRVIRRDENKFGYKEVVLAELSSWIGTKAPDLTDPGLRHALKLTHHKWRGQAERVWTDDPPPPSFKYLGCIEPTAKERRVSCKSHGSWAAFPYQRLMQWRWENERAQVLAEDEERQRQEEAQRTTQAEKRKTPTLGRLRRNTPFKEWQGHVPTETIRASRKIIRDSIDAIRALGTKPSRKGVLRVIRTGVERFNDLDAATPFISTIEREDIAESFNDMAEACGLKDIDDVTEDWRDW
jgi:hypothetical protein